MRIVDGTTQMRLDDGRPDAGIQIQAVALAFDRATHLGFGHSPGVRERKREARESVPTHPVIDPVIIHTPLDPGTIVVFAAAFGAIVFASVRRPSYGVVALIALLPFGFPHYIGDTTIGLDKVALLANAAGLLLGRRDARVLGGNTARVLLACGVGVVVATALSIVDAHYRAPVLRETLKAAQYVALFAVVLIAVAADANDRAIRIALVATTIVVSVLALAQELIGAPSGLWYDNFPIPRIAGPLEGPNQLAAYLGLLLAVITAYAIRRPKAPFELVALGLGSAALVLTISRAGVAASLAGIIVVLVASKGSERRRAVLAVAGGAIAGCAVIASWGFTAARSFQGVKVLDRFGSAAPTNAPASLGTREQLWHAALFLWRTHPIFGIGAGNFERELGIAGFPQLHTHANSLYLQALAEGGIVLAVATIALVFVSIAAFARGPFSAPLVAGALGASIGLAAHQVFDLLVFFPKVGETWWIVLALGAARLDRGADQGDDPA